MNKHKCFLGLAILATLVTTPAQAESVSRKAADLMAQNSNPTDSVDQNTNNTQPVNTPTSIYGGNDTDSKLPASNYFYLGGSVGRGFPSDVKLKGKATDPARIQLLQNANIPNEGENDLSLYPGSYWNIAGGYQWKNARAELEIGSGSFGNDELKPVPGKLDLGSQTVANNQTQPTPGVGKINLTTAFVNGYYDIATGSKFRPYLGAGIGLGFISDQDNGLIGVDYGTSFAYQGKVGVQYEVVKKGNAFVEFRYLGLTGYTSKKNNTEIEIGSINSPAVSVGYRQGF
jgi:opacity protein-like surface antigen